MTRPTDSQLLQELAAKTIGDASFALNTNNLPDAASRLRSAVSLLDRAMNAQGIKANSFDEFADYNPNEPYGNQAAVTGNAGQPADEFAGYDINAL